MGADYHHVNEPRLGSLDVAAKPAMTEAVESLDISDAERQAVFAGNARALLKLD